MSFKDLSFIPNTSSANSQKPCSLDIATCCICLNVLVSIPIPRSLRLKQRVVNFISASRLLSLRLMVALPTARTSMTYVEKNTRQAPERDKSMNSAAGTTMSVSAPSASPKKLTSKTSKERNCRSGGTLARDTYRSLLFRLQ